MLKYLRTHQKTVLWILLAFITVPFIVYYGAPGGGNKGEQDVRYVAKVNGKPITWYQYESEQNTIERQMQMEAEQRNQPINPAQRKNIPKQAYDNLVDREILYQEADRMGIEVTQDEVLQAFQMDVDQITQSWLQQGQNVTKEQIAQLYINQSYGGNEAALMEDLRNRLLFEKIIRIPNFGALVSEEDLRVEYRKRNKKIKAEFIGFKPEDYQSQIKDVSPTEDELKAWYDENKEEYKTKRQVKIRWARFSPDLFEDQVVKEIEPDSIRRKYNDISKQYQIPEKRRVQDILFAAEKFIAEATFSEPDVQQYYEAHKAEFMTPEQARARFVSLSFDQIASQVPVTEDEIAKEYKDNTQQYAVPETVNLKHILISVPRIHTKEQAAAALVKVASAQARLRAGESFEDIARDMSDDKSNASEGGDLGEVSKGQMVKPFEEAGFALKEGEISGPVETIFGYHLIKAGAHIPASTKTLDEAREEIRRKLQENGARKLAQEKLMTLRNSLEGGLTQESVGTDYSVEETTLFTQDQTDPVSATIGDDMKSFASSTFNLKAGDVSRVVFGQNRLYLIERTEKVDPMLRPLSDPEVRSDVIAGLTNERGARLGSIRSAQAKRLVQEDGMAFDDVAAQFQLSAPLSDWLAQGDTEVRNVGQSPADYLNKVFDAALGEIFEASGPDGSMHLVRLVDIQPSRSTPFEDADPQLIRNITDDLIRERATRVASTAAARFLTQCQAIVNATDTKSSTSKPPMTLDELFAKVEAPASSTASATGAATNGSDSLSHVHGVQTGTSNFFGPGEVIDGLGYNNEVAEAALALATDSFKIGTFSDQTIESGRQGYYQYYVIQMVDKRDAHIPELAEVREKVLEDYRQERAVEMAKNAAEEALQKLTAVLPSEYPVAGATRSVDLRAFARDNNYKYQIPTPFKADDYIEGVGPSPSVARTAFELKPGLISGVITVHDAYAPDPDKKKITGFYILQVIGEEPFDEEGYKAERDTLYDEVLTTNQNIAFRAWFEGLKARTKIEDLRNVQQA